MLDNASITVSLPVSRATGCCVHVLPCEVSEKQSTGLNSWPVEAAGPGEIVPKLTDG